MSIRLGDTQPYLYEGIWCTIILERAITRKNCINNQKPIKYQKRQVSAVLGPGWCNILKMEEKMETESSLSTSQSADRLFLFMPVACANNSMARFRVTSRKPVSSLPYQPYQLPSCQRLRRNSRKKSLKTGSVLLWKWKRALGLCIRPGLAGTGKSR